MSEGRKNVLILGAAILTIDDLQRIAAAVAGDSVGPGDSQLVEGPRAIPKNKNAGTSPAFSAPALIGEPFLFQ